MRLAGKIALITGGASGFGRETALRFSEEGARVAIADIDAERGADVIAKLRDDGHEATLFVGDISAATGAAAAVEGTLAAFGGLDILVNNAGIADLNSTDTWNVAEDVWDRILRVNLKSVFLCSKFAIPGMRKAGSGSIVNLASIAASAPVGGASYAASKGAIRSYTRQVARELAPHGVRVNCVSPGYMRTPMSTGEHSGVSPEEQQRRMDYFARRVPMKRTGTARDIADAIVYLASDEARYVTGQEIVVDGGYLVR